MEEINTAAHHSHGLNWVAVDDGGFGRVCHDARFC
jgi:hypothetical protein